MGLVEFLGRFKPNVLKPGLVAEYPKNPRKDVFPRKYSKKFEEAEKDRIADIRKRAEEGKLGVRSH